MYTRCSRILPEFGGTEPTTADNTFKNRCTSNSCSESARLPATTSTMPAGIQRYLALRAKWSRIRPCFSFPAAPQAVVSCQRAVSSLVKGLANANKKTSFDADGSATHIALAPLAPMQLSPRSRIRNGLVKRAPITASAPTSPILFPVSLRASKLQKLGNKAASCMASVSPHPTLLKSNSRTRRCSSQASRNLATTIFLSAGSANTLLYGAQTFFTSCSQPHSSSAKRSWLQGGEAVCRYFRQNPAWRVASFVGSKVSPNEKILSSGNALFAAKHDSKHVHPL
mmetsp:Transcript_18312/g.64318  ORF Transcript_18312/g.64318 Transcript_18312/m.64318 type:complete len:283 (+) Transcript_18312:48-896(+)